MHKHGNNVTRMYGKQTGFRITLITAEYVVSSFTEYPSTVFDLHLSSCLIAEKAFTVNMLDYKTIIYKCVFAMNIDI